jgi:hypothetical protein
MSEILRMAISALIAAPPLIAPSATDVQLPGHGGPFQLPAVASGGLFHPGEGAGVDRPAKAGFGGSDGAYGRYCYVPGVGTFSPVPAMRVGDRCTFEGDDGPLYGLITE